MSVQDKNPGNGSQDTGPEPDELPRVRSPDPYPIATGLCIIASIYLFPVFPAPGFIGAPLTLAALAVGDSALPFSGNFLYLTSFIMGWGVAIGLVVYGLANTKPDISFERA